MEFVSFHRVYRELNKSTDIISKKAMLMQIQKLEITEGKEGYLPVILQAPYD